MLSHLKMKHHNQIQNRPNNADVSNKCVKCEIPIYKSNYASSSKQLKCFQCHPQIFFRTECPICKEEVDTIDIQYHLELVHNDVFVFPCKICKEMMRKHDIIPHMKICGQHEKVLCPLCKKGMLKASLHRHMQTHTNRPKQQCHHCESKILDLKGHFKRKHSKPDGIKNNWNDNGEPEYDKGNIRRSFLSYFTHICIKLNILKLKWGTVSCAALNGKNFKKTTNNGIKA